MKKKQSPDLPSRVIKHTPEDFPRPDPMALATLAAILEPRHAPKFGLERAMRFYFAAVHFGQELPADLDELLTLYGSDEQRETRTRREFSRAIRREREDNALTLEPDRDDDEVRQYLDKCARAAGVLKKKERLFGQARSVIDNLREYYESIPVTPGSEWHLTTDEFIESLKRKADDGRDYYLIPRNWLSAEVPRNGEVFQVGLVYYKKQCRSDLGKRSAETRKEKSQRKSSEETLAKSVPL